VLPLYSAIPCHISFPRNPPQVTETGCPDRTSAGFLRDPTPQNYGARRVRKHTLWGNCGQKGDQGRFRDHAPQPAFLKLLHLVPRKNAKYEGQIKISPENGGTSAPRSQIIRHELSCGSHSSGNFLLLGNNLNVYSDHKAVDISGSRVTGTMRHGAFESPFDGGPCAKASFVGASVATDRPTLHTKMTSWHKGRQGS